MESTVSSPHVISAVAFSSGGGVLVLFCCGSSTGSQVLLEASSAWALLPWVCRSLPEPCSSRGLPRGHSLLSVPHLYCGESQSWHQEHLLLHLLPVSAEYVRGTQLFLSHFLTPLFSSHSSSFAVTFLPVSRYYQSHYYHL